MFNKYPDVRALIGKTLIAVREGEGDTELRFVTTDGDEYRMYHDQDCCESVWLEDVVGDFQDLIGSPILQAEESVSCDHPLEGSEDDYLWTFYRLSTARGLVVLRWYGTSNGYYSVAVEFEKVRKGV